MSSQEKPHYLEQELNQLVQRDPAVLAWLEQGSLDGMWYWNLENLEDEWLSPRFKTTFGYGVDEVPHTSAWWQENIHPDDLKTALANFEAHRDNPEVPYDCLVRYRHKQGHQVWIRCRGLIIRNEQGEPVRMLGAHTDVTEIKTAELRLAARNRELERSNRELEDIARAMGHDLRAPLRAITSFSELLARKYGDALDDQGQEYLAFITDGATRMRLMVEGLLRVARLDGAKDDASPVALDEVIEEVALNAASTLDARGGQLVREGDFGVVNGVRVQMVQLFQNLVENGIKFSPDGPHITVRGRVENDDLVVEVIDRGVGFPERVAGRIFNVFERAVTQDEFEGTGVGLAICKKVVERHGGEIEAYGDPGKGARFVVRLPRAS